MRRGRRRVEARVARSSNAEGDADLKNWRNFRARLVQAETGNSVGGSDQTWAYRTPVIETGSVLLAKPGNDFSLHQQYFHKAVILITHHLPDVGDSGLILNRPTGLTTWDVDLFLSDLAWDLIPKILGLSKGSSPWKVVFGGACRSIRQPMASHTCLHFIDRLADLSHTVFDGVYLMPTFLARIAVVAGQATEKDFLVVVGTCGWKAGQLQNEVDLGDYWLLLSASQNALRSICLDAHDPGNPGSNEMSEDSDGSGQWQKLYDLASPDKLPVLSDDDELPDEILHYWHRAAFSVGTSRPASSAVASTPWLGTVLRGSPTEWLLGLPLSKGTESEWVEKLGGRAQYMHKAVLLVHAVSDDNVKLLLLNGPWIGRGDDGIDHFFGGPQRTDVESLPDGLAMGVLTLKTDAFRELMDVGALEVSSVSAKKVLEHPLEQRWQASGGRIATLREASAATLGDKIKERWTKWLWRRSYLP